MTSEVTKAWLRAEAAWIKAGKPVPCYDFEYMRARRDLAKAVEKAEAARK
jgi:predicted alpha/beta-hydrolase family hydrolase